MAVELEREQPLFEAELPVQLSSPQCRDGEQSCEEITRRLSIRILRGKRRGNRSSGLAHAAQKRSTILSERLLHVEITDESDPFFLFTLDVGEEDFHELKRDQALLVDFDGFPLKFIELLERCASCVLGSCVSDKEKTMPQKYDDFSLQEEKPKFVARLETDTNIAGGKGGNNLKWARFTVIETNPFKQLAHIALQFRAGNDNSIKQYLADRLQQIVAENERLSGSLSVSEQALAEERAARAAASDELITVHQTHASKLRELQSQHSAELASRREEGVREKEETITRLEAAKIEAHRVLENDLSSLRERLNDAENRVQDLTSSKYVTEAQLREKSAKIEAIESSNTEMQNEVEKVRMALQSSDARRFLLESETQESRLKISALEQKVLDKEELQRQSSDLIAAAENAKRHQDQSLERMKTTSIVLQDKLKMSVMEINKGNEVIARLQRDLKLLREKNKAKSDVLREQERKIAEERRRGEEIETRRHTANLANDRLQEQNSRLKTELKDAKLKLEESSTLLESNRQTIAWLNKELNSSVGTIPFGAGPMNAIDSTFMKIPDSSHVKSAGKVPSEMSTIETCRNENNQHIDVHDLPIFSVDLSGALNVPAVSPTLQDGLKVFTKDEGSYRMQRRPENGKLTGAGGFDNPGGFIHEISPSS